MTTNKAMAYIRKHGVVLVSAKGPLPRLVEAIAKEPIEGSWWAHPKNHKIFAVLESVCDSPDILVCRLVDGKLTLVHKRLWPALVRAAGRFPGNQLARVRQEHTPAGHHINREIAFPKWAPAAVMEEASALSEQAAIAALGSWASYT